MVLVQPPGKYKVKKINTVNRFHVRIRIRLKDVVEVNPRFICRRFTTALDGLVSNILRASWCHVEGK